MVNRNRGFRIFILIFCAFCVSGFAKNKASSPAKNSAQYQQYIDPSYFLQITLDLTSCEKIIGDQCLFRDKFLDDPYYHETKLLISLQKIYAVQTNQFNDSKLLAVKDGQYKLITDNNNLISLTVANGDISKLYLLKGSLENEQNNLDKCQKNKMLYDFYTTYKRQNDLIIKSGIYIDEYDFDEVKNYLVFHLKNNLSEVMALSQSPTKTVPFTNIRLCRMPLSTRSNVRHITVDECQMKVNSYNEECFKYHECQDHLAVENCQVTLFNDAD